MATTLNPYLGFKDNARDALEFYHGVFGGELVLNTFGDFQASEEPAEKEKIMHGQVTGANGLTLMGSDTPNAMEYNTPKGFSVSLSGGDEAELRGYWDKLVDGGTIIEPLAVAPWGDSFGMCTDRFGIGWMVNIAGRRG
ncbi:VOC family protein [Arthrobacter sp. KK5.5]|uniref:VOC family protein n=1 Tax=Arthrobacter sp. KK5.5 TaxID=3373084 RepID=UPI003EE7A431